MTTRDFLPCELREACREARETMEKRVDHVLPAKHRWRILAAFGPRDDGAQPRDQPGRRKRAILSFLAARRALRLYRKMAPACDAIPAAFDAALSLFKGEISQSEARSRLEAGAIEVESFKVPGPAAIYAGKSVLEALVCVLEDCFFLDPGTNAPEPEDAQTGGDDNDAASFAAAAFARAAHDADADPAEARREFWTWWLDSTLAVF